jgi:hypothetical protein
MRKTLLALAVAALGGFMAASCGNSSNKGDMGGTSDMGAAPPDMVVTKLNCEGVGTCVYNCLINGQGDLGTCAQTICAKTAKAGSVQKWINAVVCGENYCVGDADMMTGKCVEVTVPPSDMGAGGTLLCDPGSTAATCNSPSYMSKVCSPCLDNARNFWFIDEVTDPTTPNPPTFMCADASSADCTMAASTCMTAFGACRNDM